MKIQMPKQDAKRRVKNFDEVNLGYSHEQAVAEAKRCLQCINPRCVQGCPVSVDIPKFIKEIVDGDRKAAINTIKKTNSLPAICGRVCPQENQCEKACVLAFQKKPIAIGYLERYASEHEEEAIIPDMKRNGHKVAVVGSGPAGLTCAADLAKMGYEVTIYEALHKPGGVLEYGIPEFRLPKAIVRKEIDEIRKLGVEIRTNAIAGRLFTVDELLKSHSAVFIGTGAGLPYFLGIPGENLIGVYSANEFLTRVNLMKAGDKRYDTPVRVKKKVVVIGGGNVAMDAARVSRRLGAEVCVVYRRSFDEMPARAEEIHHAKEEGIEFMILTSPSKVLGEKSVEGLECIQMRLSEPGPDQRRSPLPIDGSEFVIDCDTVIVAIGQGPNPLIRQTSNIEHSKRGNISVGEDLMTSVPGVFAGGDIVGAQEIKGGGATVIKAMGDGRIAAKAIDRHIKKL